MIIYSKSISVSKAYPIHQVNRRHEFILNFKIHYLLYIYSIGLPSRTTKSPYSLQQEVFMASSSYSVSPSRKACALQYTKLRCRCGKATDVKISGTNRNPNKFFFILVRFVVLQIGHTLLVVHTM
jgi:hypothetical protein